MRNGPNSSFRSPRPIRGSALADQRGSTRSEPCPNRFPHTHPLHGICSSSDLPGTPLLLLPSRHPCFVEKRPGCLIGQDPGVHVVGLRRTSLTCAKWREATAGQGLHDPRACSYPLTACWGPCLSSHGRGRRVTGRRVRRVAVGRPSLAGRGVREAFRSMLVNPGRGTKSDSAWSRSSSSTSQFLRRGPFPGLPDWDRHNRATLLPLGASRAGQSPAKHLPLLAVSI